VTFTAEIPYRIEVGTCAGPGGETAETSWRATNIQTSSAIVRYEIY
jgi:hypothetical protein